MHKVIVIGLTGHTRQYRLSEEAYEALHRYLDDARSDRSEQDAAAFAT